SPLDSYDKTTPDVPVLANVFPSSKIPEPIAPHALSAPPANTFVAALNPVASAISAVIVPTSSCEPTRGGQISGLIPRTSQISLLQFFSATFKSNVPAASEYSICNCPVNFKRT